MRTFWTAVAAIAVISSAACARDSFYPTQDCNSATNQRDINQCAQDNFESADRALNDVYHRVMDELPDQGAKDQLRDSERAWISFRDRECSRQVGPREGGGSIWPMNLANCLEEKTAGRIRELRHSVDCPNGPNACAR
jgi:uncharacterized protein YecT (DUF1311 family)